MSQNLDPTKSETSLPRKMLCLRMLVRPKMTKATSDWATTNSKQFDRLMWVLRSELEDLWGLNPILWSGTSSVTSSSARRTKASVSWSLSSISRVATTPLVPIKTHQPNDFPPLNIFLLRPQLFQPGHSAKDKKLYLSRKTVCMKYDVCIFLSLSSQQQSLVCLHFE